MKSCVKELYYQNVLVACLLHRSVTCSPDEPLHCRHECWADSLAFHDWADVQEDDMAEEQQQNDGDPAEDANARSRPWAQNTCSANNGC